jgi:hypothetical protein
MDPPILEAPAETAVQEPAASAFAASEDSDSLDIATGVLNGLFFAGVLVVILLLPIVIYLLW